MGLSFADSLHRWPTDPTHVLYILQLWLSEVVRVRTIRALFCHVNYWVHPSYVLRIMRLWSILVGEAPKLPGQQHVRPGLAEGPLAGYARISIFTKVKLSCTISCGRRHHTMSSSGSRCRGARGVKRRRQSSCRPFPISQLELNSSHKLIINKKGGNRAIYTHFYVTNTFQWMYVLINLCK